MNTLFFTQKPVLNISFKDFWYTKNKSDSGVTNSINKHLRLKIPYTDNIIF